MTRHHVYAVMEGLRSLRRDAQRLDLTAQSALSYSEQAVLHGLATSIDAALRLVIERHGMDAHDAERWVADWLDAGHALDHATDHDDLAGWLQLHPHAPETIADTQRYLDERYPGTWYELHLSYDPECGSRQLNVRVHIKGVWYWMPEGEEQIRQWLDFCHRIDEAVVFSRPPEDWGDMLLDLGHFEEEELPRDGDVA